MKSSPMNFDRSMSMKASTKATGNQQSDESAQTTESTIGRSQAHAAAEDIELLGAPLLARGLQAGAAGPRAYGCGRHAPGEWRARR